MNKVELVHLHILFAQLKKFCEEQGLDCDFSKYNEMEISPFEGYRKKEEHKQAIFVLATELASMVAKKPKCEDGTNKKQKEVI